MELITKKDRNVIVFELSGTIIGGPESAKIHQDINTFLEKGEKKFVIDLAKVTIINSSGLGTLIASLTSVKKAGGGLKIAAANDKITNIFVVTKLNTIFELVEDVEKAVSGFNK